MYHGFIVQIPDSFSPSTDFTPAASSAYVVIETTTSPFPPSAEPLASNVVSISVQQPDGTLLSAKGLSRSVNVTQTLTNVTNSPACVVWESAGSSWTELGKSAVTTTNQAIGSTVSCSIGELGSFAIRDTCSDATTCSGHGSCKLDGTCECNLGWTGTSCSQQYCDSSSLLECRNQGKCVCPVTCKANCENSGNSEDVCEQVCQQEPLLTADQCPSASGVRQTTCWCKCGFTGAYCEVDLREHGVPDVTVQETCNKWLADTGLERMPGTLFSL